MKFGSLKTPAKYSDSATITTYEIVQIGRFVLTGSSKTYTIPTPCYQLRREYVEFISNSTGSNSVACTNGFPAGGDAVTVPAGVAVRLVCLEDGSGAFLWYQDAAGATELTSDQLAALNGAATPSAVNVFATMADITGEIISDAVGAMVTGNTETGIAVAYQDSDNTLDFTVAYGTASSTACEGNDSRLPGTIAAFSPTLGWSGGSPTVTAEVYRQQTVNKRVSWLADVTGSNGNNATTMTLTFPAGLVPADVNMKVPVKCQVSVNAGAFANVVATLDCEDATEGNRKLTVSTGTLTTGQAFRIIMEGSHEIA